MRHDKVTATVTDSVSGPVAPMVSARANTSHVRIDEATLVGSNKAGFVLDLCSYTVLPVKLKTAPSIHSTFRDRLDDDRPAASGERRRRAGTRERGLHRSRVPVLLSPRRRRAHMRIQAVHRDLQSSAAGVAPQST